jgi:hypothetical protein
MKKTMLALATVATMAVGTLSAPTTADARCYGCAVGAGVAAGVIGGAIIGGAIANSQAQAADAYSYCSQRYRSYDPASGTYLNNDGNRYPCP